VGHDYGQAAGADCCRFCRSLFVHFPLHFGFTSLAGLNTSSWLWEVVGLNGMQSNSSVSALCRNEQSDGNNNNSNNNSNNNMTWVG